MFADEGSTIPGDGLLKLDLDLNIGIRISVLFGYVAVDEYAAIAWFTSANVCLFLGYPPCRSTVLSILPPYTLY